MKKLLVLIVSLMVSTSLFAKQSYNHFNSRPVPDWFRNGVTYQLMPRCFSEEGTLKGAEKHLERLADLGVTVVYLLPVNIADTDMDRSKWSPRQIKSGFNDPRNPYRAGDFFHVDPEYGTDQDLKDFINKAHSLGMKVFVDIVFAHCGPGAAIVKQHPEFFKYNDKGEMMLTKWKFPMFDPGYSGTRAYFRSIMSYYVADFDVDGFRCDTARHIPISFWEEARIELERMKPDIVVVAESNEPYNTRYGFEADYNWAVFSTVRFTLDKKSRVEGKGGMAYVRERHERQEAVYPKGSLHWNMTENHDKATDDFDNRFEKRHSHACGELTIALSFAIDGIPFLFNGQEIGHNKRVSMFGHKDCWIDWKTDGVTEVAKDRTAKIKAWAKMRKEQKALTHGATKWIDNDCPAEVLSFRRVYEGCPDVLFVGNFSDKEVKVELADGSKHKLAPWGYVFEVQKK